MCLIEFVGLDTFRRPMACSASFICSADRVYPRPQLGRHRQDETRQPKRLSEQELREALIRRERELTAAERKRGKATPEKPKDRGLDFGFD